MRNKCSRLMSEFGALIAVKKQIILESINDLVKKNQSEVEMTRATLLLDIHHIPSKPRIGEKRQE